MDIYQATNIDNMMVGPRLFCEVCSNRKVLSPCYNCQYFEAKKASKRHCRGCGFYRNHCQKEYEICKVLEKHRLLRDINKIILRQEIVASFRKCDLKELPQEIGQLTHLKLLILGNNQLKELPQEIAQLTHLQLLDINHNQLREFPLAITNLINLQVLDLGSNQLRDLPREIAQLTNLKKLVLSHNQLRELPQEIAQLTDLQEINVSNNQLHENTICYLKKALPNTVIKAL